MATQSVLTPERTEARRVYNREYMQRWRAANPERARANDARWKGRHWAQILERNRMYSRSRGVKSSAGLCGFCHQRQVVKFVERFLPVNNDWDFERVLVPYCGQC
jgi:hypothetical protein